MNKFINENLLKMNTEEFLDNIKKAFNDVFSDGNIEKTDLMGYLSENKGRSITYCIRIEKEMGKKVLAFLPVSLSI